MNETIKQIRLMPDDEIYDIQADPTRTATSETGSRVLEFTDGADAPLVKCVTQIQGYQSGTGTPSPDNVRPIVAYTEGEIEVSDGDGNSTTHTIDLNGSCYFGTLDVVRGKLVITHGEYILNSVLNVNRSGPKQYYINAARTPNSIRDGEIHSILCDKIRSKQNWESPYIDGICFVNESGAIRFNTVNAYETAADMLSDMGDLQFVYPYNTPVEIDLSPTVIRTLSGYNHIESTTGDMEVEYITQGEQPILDLITDEKVKQTNYTTSSYIGDTFTLPFSKDNTSTSGTSDLYKNTGIAVRVRSDETWLTTMDSGSTEDTTLNQTTVKSTGVQVMNRTSTTDIPNTMTVKPTDIQLTGTNNTWDGTNISLKSALSALADTYEKTIYVTGLGTVDIGGDLDYNQSIMVTYYITYKYDNVDYCVYESYFGRSSYGSGSWGYGHTLEFAVTDKTPQQYTKGTHLHVGVNSYYGAPLAVGVWCNSEDESHITNIDGLIRVVIDRNPLTIS